MDYVPSPLEEMLCRSDLFGLTSASPAQRAYCRLADGYDLGPLWQFAEVRAMCGGVRPAPIPPELLMLIVAIRSGKSLIAAATGVSDALNADLSKIREGEANARVPIVSVDKDNAKAVFGHLVGHVTNSPVLAPLVVDKPTSDTLLLRRPSDSKIVEIKVTAMGRAGATLTGRWMAGAVIDEVTLITGDDDAAKTLKDQLKSLKGRMCPGTRITLIGSTVAPSNTDAYDMLMSLFGHGLVNGQLALWPTGPDFNPTYYDAPFCSKLKQESPAHHKAATTRTFIDPETGFLSPDIIEARTLTEIPEPPKDPDPRCFAAAMDPASRKNGWGLVIMENLGGAPERFRIVRVREWRPESGDKLSPKRTLAEIADEMAVYGLTSVMSDHYMLDALIDFADELGITIEASHPSVETITEAFLKLEGWIVDGYLDLHPDPLLQRDLKAVKKRIASDRSFHFVLPRTNDGRHCDTIPPLVRLTMRPPLPPEPPAPKVTMEDELFHPSQLGSEEDVWGRLWNARV